MYHICVDNISHHFFVDNGHIPKHVSAQGYFGMAFEYTIPGLELSIY